MKTISIKAVRQLIHARWAFGVYLILVVWAIAFVWSRYVMRAQAVTEAAIQNQTILLETMTQARTAVIYVDKDSRITKWGGAASYVFGWPRHEAVGRPIDILLPSPEIAANHRLMVSNALALHADVDDPRVKIILCKAKRKTGELIDIVIRLTVDHDNQRVFALIDRMSPGLIYDVTTHRTMP